MRIFIRDSFWGPLVLLARHSWFPICLRLRLLKAILVVLHNPQSLLLPPATSPCVLAGGAACGLLAGFANATLLHEIRRKFCDAEGILMLVHLLDQCATVNGFHPVTTSETATENGQSYSNVVDSSMVSMLEVGLEVLELATAAIFTLSKAITRCDYNKVCNTVVFEEGVVVL